MKKKYQVSQHRDTGLAVCLILTIATLFTSKQVFLIGLLVSLVLTMTIPKWTFLFTPLWFGLSHILGAVISKVIFSLIFFLLAMPVGIFRKIMGKDVMGLKLWQSGPTTSFLTRNHTFTAKDLQHPF